MTRRVYLHVGAPKSGTTYLQQVLETNRAHAEQFWRDLGYVPVGEPVPYTYDRLTTTAQRFERPA